MRYKDYLNFSICLAFLAICINGKKKKKRLCYHVLASLHYVREGSETKAI